MVVSAVNRSKVNQDFPTDKSNSVQDDKNQLPPKKNKLAPPASPPPSKIGPLSTRGDKQPPAKEVTDLPPQKLESTPVRFSKTEKDTPPSKIGPFSTRRDKQPPAKEVTDLPPQKLESTPVRFS
ncbi:hypothetical protein MUU53_04145, partial [Rhizobium lemnae]|nr:hypothetical protein [Rhizobium lemnae]